MGKNTEMPWEYRPALYKQTLEHFFTSREAMVIPCTDKKAVMALRHGLNRYYVQTAQEAQKGNAAAMRLAVVIPQIMVTNREMVLTVSLRDERINVDFEKMAEAVALQRETAGVTTDDLKREIKGEKKKTYYD